MIRKMRQTPFFLVLLPTFFVFHGFVENCFFIRFRDCWALLGLYTGASLVLFAFSTLLLKDRIKAAIFASFMMAFYLFFGALHDFLREHRSFLHKYSILLPGFVVLSVLLFFYLKKKASFGRTVFFLNSLLLLYLLVDSGTLLWKTVHKNAMSPGDLSYTPVSTTRCDSCPKPDIYFLLFDEYSGNGTLKDRYHYDNSGLDSFLKKEGFRVQKNSFSNYLNTPLSMASILNFDYLPPLHDVGPDEFNDMIGAIGKSRVANFMYAQGYSVVNYSPFDLPGQPSLEDQPFIPVKTRLITNRTLLHYVIRDLQPWINTHFGDSAHSSIDKVSDIDRINRQFYSLTIEETKKSSARPRFVYTHLFMPHFPYFFDSLMHKRPLRDVVANANEDNLSWYLDYLPFTNSRAETLISAIRKNTQGKAVIIFLSDHGFRYYGDGNGNIRHLYNNQNAVYYPDGDYGLLYDSISAVNEFRVVFDKLFRQNLPLLKDSAIYLQEKR